MKNGSHAQQQPCGHRTPHLRASFMPPRLLAQTISAWVSARSDRRDSPASHRKARDCPSKRRNRKSKRPSSKRQARLQTVAAQPSHRHTCIASSSFGYRLRAPLPSVDRPRPPHPSGKFIISVFRPDHISIPSSTSKIIAHRVRVVHRKVTLGMRCSELFARSAR